MKQIFNYVRLLLCHLFYELFRIDYSKYFGLDSPVSSEIYKILISFYWRYLCNDNKYIGTVY